MDNSEIDDNLKKLLSNLVPPNHLANALNASRTTKKAFNVLFEKVNNSVEWNS